MSLKNLLGRDREIHRLQLCLAEERAQLVVLYGRRRVGKTFLVNEFFDGRFDFKITGAYKVKKDVQLSYFAEELTNQTQTEQDVPENWAKAFAMLRRYLLHLPTDEKHVVFFDEMPWLDTPQSDFLPAFEHFWNDFGCAMHNLVFIICGSATSWMIKNISENKGGLFERQTCSICLQPFTLKETEAYLARRGIEWSRYDIVEGYMVMGGIPYYLSLLDPELTLGANIDNLFFRKRAELWNEFNQLYRTLFTNSEKYIQVVEALSKKRMGLTRSEIVKATGFDNNGDLTKILANLVDSDFVRVTLGYGKKTRDLRYQLRDYYSLFYFRFIKGGFGRDEHFWTHSYGSASKNVWAGVTFEQVCRDHVAAIKQKLGIAGVLSEESVFLSPGSEDAEGAQIDLVIDRRDHVIDLCEIKHTEKEFVIDKDYDQSLRRKREVFREKTNTKSTLRIVMVATYGVKQNKYSSLVSAQVTMDDLFA